MINRDELGKLLNFYGLKGNGLELGVQKGEFSKKILEHWEGQMLYLVDCWESQENYEDIANKQNHEKNYKETCKNLKPYSNKTKIIKKYSAEAAKDFPDNYFDFIYIDANHSYQEVKNDLQTWYPKLKNNGLFCGHDYIDGEVKNTTTNEILGVFGVKSAVDEFTKNFNKKVYASGCGSWYFFKTKPQSIAFLNAYDDNYKIIANKTVPNKKEYCQKHGYAFIETINEYLPQGHHPAFAKFSIALRTLPFYDYVFFNDADTLVMNHNIKLEDFIDQNYDLIISYDINGLNTSNWLIKNSAWAFNFLMKVFNRTEFASFGGWADQIALINTWIYSGEAIQKTKLVPQKLFNSYLYETFGKNEFNETPFWPQGQYHPGDFLLHLCGQNQQQRINNIEKYLKEILK